jgi:hypothetical protein
MQQLAWIQTLPNRTLYVLLLLTMKKEVGTILFPTVRSTLRTPFASEVWLLKSLSVTLVLIKSPADRPKQRSTEYDIMLTAKYYVNQHLVNWLAVYITLEI